MKKKILIVEDDTDISEVVKSFLNDSGYQAECAENGSVALDLIQKQGLPNLILLDMKMPVVNGWQFAEQFHSRYDRKAPIVVMTAAGDGEQRAKDVDASGWIRKPFRLNELLDAVKAHM